MTASSDASIAEDQEQARVIEYLRSHPDLLTESPDLLTALNLPHDSGGAVSLIERQVKLLREQANSYRQQLEDLIAVARDNESLNRRLHRLTLALIDARDLTEVLNTLQDELRDQFNADAVELKLLSADELAEAASKPGSGPAMLREFLDKGRPSCGRLDSHQLEYLFGEQAGETGSAALIPIRGIELTGVLAIGSRSPGHFHPGKGVDFLTRLGELVSKTLQAASSPGA